MMSIGILGTGVMGPQIAAALAIAGHDVHLYNHRDPAQTLPRLKQWLRYGARQDPSIAPDLERFLQSIHLTTDLNVVRDTALVIESVIEDLPVKQALFGRLSRLCRPETILASNSSSLDLLSIGREVTDKGRLLGLHFFNPVFDTGLVEVIITPEAKPVYVEKAVELVKALKKVPLTVPESCVNRILFPMINEACMALEQGVFKASDIDQAFKLGANHPIGPLALADLIGLDVVVAILESLQKRLGVRYKPASILYSMVARGHLGRKAGLGFFPYGKLKIVHGA
jgi:3-hydroxybutyryl-CoA dehydrogenase